MMEAHAHQIYCNRDYLLNVFEIHRLALLKNDPVLVRYIDKPYFNSSVAVAIGQLAEEYKLVVTNGVFRSVDCLNDVYDTRHSRYSVEDYPVADDCRQQNRSYLVHFNQSLQNECDVAENKGDLTFSRCFRAFFAAGPSRRLSYGNCARHQDTGLP